jgi:carbonic anhydrase
MIRERLSAEYAGRITSYSAKLSLIESEFNQSQFHSGPPMDRSIKLLLGVVVLGLVAYPSIGRPPKDNLTPASALAELKAGNARHAVHHYQHPHQTTARQRELTSGQHPHAEILSCADSRVPPEIIFDQGLGDLFVVRVAGNVATEAELASLEYGADHLHIPLLVVVGHENCGAVTAALEGGPAEGHISTLVQLLQPAIEKSRQLPGDPLANAVRTNVEIVVQQLRTSTPILSELVAHGKLKIIGAVYSLKTGTVTWLPETNSE